MTDNPYKRLALRLDALPNGYPSTEDGAELRVLEYLFSPEEADLAAQLRLAWETAAQIAERLGRDKQEIRKLLKQLTRKGLIEAGRTEGGFGYQILPFAIGFYEYQFDKIDKEFAQLFEDYYTQALKHIFTTTPQLTRVIPVNETVRNDLEVQPYENILDYVDKAKAWGVQECLCRNQKELIDDPCDHPKEVCMSLSMRPGLFDHHPAVRALNRDEAVETLKMAADAGLVHQVSNSQEGNTEGLLFICNCCSCSCGILRGMAEMGIANVVAKSSFINTVDEDLCNGCEDCIEYCQFDALKMDDFLVTVSDISCTGCGVCVPSCTTGALSLIRREEKDITEIPETEDDWRAARSEARGLDISEVR